MEQNYFSLNESWSLLFLLKKKTIRKLNSLILSFLYYLRGWKGRLTPSPGLQSSSFSFQFRELANGRMAQPDGWQPADPPVLLPLLQSSKTRETGHLKGQQDTETWEKTGKVATLHLAPQTREIFLVMYTDVTFGCVASQCLPKTLICILSSIHFILSYSIPAPKQSDWCDPMQESTILCTSDHDHWWKRMFPE